MVPLIIGLTGKAEHGKTAASRIIREWTQDQNGGLCDIVEISKIIYDQCVQLGILPAGLTREELTNEQVKILVDEGHKYGERDRHYWINQVLDIAHEGADVLVIPNIRRPEEGEAIRKRGGFIIRINRLNPDGTPFISSTRDPNHPLETMMDRWPSDFYMVNQTGHGKLFERNVVAVMDYIIDEVQK